MPFTIIAPGKRKGNRNYIFRGRVAGNLREITTDFGPGTPARVLRGAAEKAERELWAEHEARRVPRPGEAATFRQASVQYLNARDPDAKRRRYRQTIEKLMPALGDRRLRDITAADVISLANQLYPTATLASRNTLAIVPAAAIIHFAARNNWCPDIRIPQFKIPPPRNRDVSDEVAQTLINSLPEGSPNRLLMLWLFRQGDRISDPLGVTWDEIDLRGQKLTMLVNKTDKEVTRPLDDELFEALAAVPEAERVGYVFPWRTRATVYKWLGPYCKRLGIQFTPHMARHTLGRQLNAAGVRLATIMEVLGHKDLRSSIRYQSVDEDAVRDALRSVGRRR